VVALEASQALMATNSSKTSTPYLNTAQVERAYSRYAHLYDVTFGKLFNEPRRIGVECLDVQSGERILEVGVGTGISLSHYRNDCSITAIDVSDEMLEHSQLQIKRHGLNHVTIANMDAANMQFSDNSFDAVMAAYVITAVPDHKTVIQEMVRVCRPGGRIVFINHFSNGNQLIGSMEKLVSPLCRHLGFRTDLGLQAVLDGTTLQVIRKRSVTPLGLGNLVECINLKTA